MIIRTLLDGRTALAVGALLAVMGVVTAAIGLTRPAADPPPADPPADRSGEPSKTHTDIPGVPGPEAHEPPCTLWWRRDVPGLTDTVRRRLDRARAEKVKSLRRLCDRLHSLARRAATDEKMLGCFAVNRRLWALRRRGEAPRALLEKADTFRKAFNEYYITRYLAFYDILFVDRGGDVFYSIRHEDDLGANLLAPPHRTRPLGRQLAEAPGEEAFVDFHFYGPSQEPAAFFVEPVRIDGRHAGWLVLQCAANKINALFGGVADLAPTGESFLVNRDGYMLTQSNFQGDSTILERRLAEENIRAKFTEGRGHRTVIDYRGVAALSSFEVFEFLGARWLVVVKMDEAQALTEAYRRDRGAIMDELRRRLSTHSPGPCGAALARDSRDPVWVDMDEFARARHGEVLSTVGVATCTGLVAAYPGRVGYLAHIGPNDRVYGEEDTHLLTTLVDKLKTYDIYKYQRRYVRFTSVAPHLESLPGVVDTLVDEGFLLTQIDVMTHPGARSARVRFDYSNNRIEVTWRIVDNRGGEFHCIHYASEARNVGLVVRDILFELD
jgi:hypothetical protein